MDISYVPTVDSSCSNCTLNCGNTLLAGSHAARTNPTTNSAQYDSCSIVADRGAQP